MNELKKFGIFSILTLDNNYKTRAALNGFLFATKYFERYREEEFFYSDVGFPNGIREDLCGKNPCVPMRYHICRE